MSNRLHVFGAGVVLSLSAIAHAEPSVQQRAERLAALRAEVEALAAEVQAESAEAQSRLRAVEAGRVETEVQIRRQELRLERLLGEEASHRAALASGADADPDLRASVERGHGELRALVASGLPFKQEQRLTALDDIRSALDKGTVTAEQAAARLWAFAEDERRLTREVALDRQVVDLGDEQVLVDVARVGMVALYWRAPDETVGRARRTDAGWTWEPMGGAEGEQVEDFFSALDKGIRTGLFPLPALTAEVER